MAKIPRDSNLFNNIVKCLRKVTRVDFDKYGRTDPIQRFVNKATDEMTQDICFLMDEVTNNLDSMYSEIKHIFNYYNVEMEKIASKFHEKNLCQNDADKLQAELVKSVTDLNTKAESLKSDLQAQQSEFQKYIHGYIMTLQQKSQRNYQILNKLKMKQHRNITDQDGTDSIKDMIEIHSKSNTLQFTSASMSSNGIGMFPSSIDSQTPSTSTKADFQNKSKLDLENTSKNLDEICRNLKMTTKNLEKKNNLELSSNTTADQANPKSVLNIVLAIEEGQAKNDKSRKLETFEKATMKSHTNDTEKLEEEIKSLKISDKLMPPQNIDTKSFEDTKKISDNEMINLQKTMNDIEKKSLKTKESVTSRTLQQKSNVGTEIAKLKAAMEAANSNKNNSIQEVSRTKAMENLPNQMDKKSNELNGSLSQTQLNEENDKLISRTSSLPHDPSDKESILETQNQLIQYDDSQNKHYNKLATKTIHHSSVSDSFMNRKIQNEWTLQSATNANDKCPPPCYIPPLQPPPCCIPTAPPASCCSPPGPDPCNDPCEPCEKDESHGSVKYDLFDAYMCSKLPATRYMDYLDSVRKALQDKNPNEAVCNKIIMSHTEFLEAVDTRQKLLRSIEKHRELQNECLEPSTLAKLKAIVTCKLGRLKSCSGVATKPSQPQQQYISDSSSSTKGQQSYTNAIAPAVTHPTVVQENAYPVITPVESQQQYINQKSLPAPKPLRYAYPEEMQYQYTPPKPLPPVDEVPYTFGALQKSSPVDDQAVFSKPQQYSHSQDQSASISETQLSAKQKQYTYPTTAPTSGQEQHIASQTEPATKYEQYSYSKPQPVAKQEQYTYSEAQSTARQEQHIHPKSQHAIRQEQYSSSGTKSAARQDQHSYPEAQPAARYEQHSYPVTQHAARQEQYIYPETQPIAKQEQQTHQHSPFTSSEMQSTAEQPETISNSPATPYQSHRSQPLPQENIIYPEMRPFEPKTSPMRHHIEQKIAAAAKSKIEQPNPLPLPVKSIHIHENLPIRKSGSYPPSESQNNSSFTSETQQNSPDNFTSKTSNLGFSKTAYTKFQVKRKPFKVTPAKRSTFK